MPVPDPKRLLRSHTLCHQACKQQKWCYQKLMLPMCRRWCVCTEARPSSVHQSRCCPGSSAQRVCLCGGQHARPSSGAKVGTSVRACSLPLLASYWCARKFFIISPSMSRSRKAHGKWEVWSPLVPVWDREWHALRRGERVQAMNAVFYSL